jgi:hypothetical protein
MLRQAATRRRGSFATARTPNPDIILLSFGMAAMVTAHRRRSPTAACGTQPPFAAMKKHRLVLRYCGHWPVDPGRTRGAEVAGLTFPGRPRYVPATSHSQDFVAPSPGDARARTLPAGYGQPVASVGCGPGANSTRWLNARYIRCDLTVVICLV